MKIYTRVGELERDQNETNMAWEMDGASTPQTVAQLESAFWLRGCHGRRLHFVGLRWSLSFVGLSGRAGERSDPCVRYGSVLKE